MTLIKDSFKGHFGSFGRRQLKRILERKGVTMSEYKISRIMKILGLEAKYGRKRIRNNYTSPETKKHIPDNYFAQLSAEEREDKTIWAMDFTESLIQRKKVYTCAIIDLRTRRILGCRHSNKINKELAIATIEDGLKANPKPDMITTDRGTQFTSKLFHDTLKSLGIVHSMSRPHKPVDNTYIETFFKSMKVEIGKIDHLNQQQYVMILDYYIQYYNYLRPHSLIGYRTPMEKHLENCCHVK